MTNEIFELSIGCTTCGGKLIAEVGPTDPDVQPVKWVCPHCFHLHTTDFAGKLISVTAVGETPQPPKPKTPKDTRLHGL